ncbi:MAG: aminotransferase class I/II-fold pyridoxal phosphate-dependent enzyme [Candidatus Krumholzibacteria bacterium]|nr:aminotransferase class I/II-fold pyridoxal phosphate-dependent enzyme [Candidatus Krumholzibacteria bacterium]
MFRERFDASLENIRMSPIVSISEEVRRRSREFEKSGRSMIRFQRGEIDFSTPQFIISAAKEGLDRGLTKYPKSGGEDFLKQSILRKLEREQGVNDLSPDNIVVTYGGQEGLELSFKLFSNGAGFSPTWSCALENFVPYAGLDFTEIPLKDDFSVDYERLEANVRGKDFFYLNNPQNPTGKVFDKGELKTIVDICTRNGCYIISDEAYEKFVYDGLEHRSTIQYCQENIIAIFTMSKSFSMTGWRIGYVVTRNKRIAQLLRLGNYTQTAGVTTFLQYAAAKALDDQANADRAIGEMKAEFAKRRDALYSGLERLPGIRLSKPEGAFYMFPNFTEVIPPHVRGKQREKYIYELLMQQGIATVYGSCFGRHFVDNVRLSFSATPVDQIEEAIGRFEQIFSKRSAA